MWGATLIGRLLIAFVFPLKQPRKAMVFMAVFCTAFYFAMMQTHSQLPAILLLFAFAAHKNNLIYPAAFFQHSKRIPEHRILPEQKILLFHFTVHPASGSTGKYNRCCLHNPSISNHSASPPVACRFAH